MSIIHSLQKQRIAAAQRPAGRQKEKASSGVRRRQISPSVERQKGLAYAGRIMRVRDDGREGQV